LARLLSIDPPFKGPFKKYVLKWGEGPGNLTKNVTWGSWRGERITRDKN